MRIQGQDVSGLDTKEIIGMLSADSFPDPFTHRPVYGEFLGSRYQTPENDREIDRFLREWKGKALPPQALKQALHLKHQVLKEFDAKTEELFAGLRAGRKDNILPSGYPDYLLDLNKLLATHYTQIGDRKLAHAYHLAVFESYLAKEWREDQYKAMAGADDRAYIIEESQRGILSDHPLGTLKVTSCIACVIQGSDGTIQLAHFNKGANIVDAFDHIRREMPGPYTVTPVGAVAIDDYFNRMLGETARQNMQDFVDALKDRPDIDINAAWVCKPPEKHTMHFVVEPGGAMNIALPHKWHQNQQLENNLVLLQDSSTERHHIELRLDMRHSLDHKPIFLTARQLQNHYKNAKNLDENFFANLSDDTHSHVTVIGRPYHDYLGVAKLTQKIDFARETMGAEFDKRFTKLTEHIDHITLDGKEVSCEAAKEAMQAKVTRMPKFIGQGQEKLNNSLIKDLLQDKAFFRADGHGTLCISTRGLNKAVQSLGEALQAAALKPVEISSR